MTPRTLARQLAALAGAFLLAAALATASAAQAAAVDPVGRNAPYEYLGWGNPPDPVGVLSAGGVKELTLAFMLSDGTCAPAWDGTRPLTGGSDQSAIDRIRAAGGDVVVSFGGWAGNKLGQACGSPSALAAAYQKVIATYRLRAIDIDIENTEVADGAVRQRVISALKILKTADPGLKVYVTFGTTPSGPDATGLDLIARGAAARLPVDGWVIMPFDFGGHTGSMGAASTAAADSLAHSVAAAYGCSLAAAYRHIGISSMNGDTDEADEALSPADFTTMLNYARTHHLARFTFWAVNRDRPCPAGTAAGDTCSGIDQSPYEFTRLIARYHG
ncbi:chitinase [Kitasatospora sp. MAA4]|uniref:chitinase n=1 Tax=Kitasatospora sp. MAA4 TaxID=3035093 RepID=UPI0024734FA6|nr:chitinase [Kitasatospora sp. MAA4]MDH6133681.1 chitinase [Kitasatospora sp. MAA4]